MTVGESMAKAFAGAVDPGLWIVAAVSVAVVVLWGFRGGGDGGGDDWDGGDGDGGGDGD